MKLNRRSSVYSFWNFFCPFPASVPVWRTEKTARSRHRPHHPPGQQLVSTDCLTMSFFTVIINLHSPSQYQSMHYCTTINTRLPVMEIYAMLNVCLCIGRWTNVVMVNSLSSGFCSWLVLTVLFAQVYKRQTQNSPAHDWPVKPLR